MDSGLRLWGVLGATGIVLPNDSPTLVKFAARLAKLVFGARIQVCNGVNDQVEIQAVIAALPANAGQVILLEGNYSITAGIEVVNHLRISGQGIRSTRLNQAAACNIFQYTGGPTVFFVTIEHLGVFGDKSTHAAGHGFALDANTSDGLLFDCWAVSFKEENIAVGTWNWRVIGCKSEYSDSYGISGGNEVIACHSMLNNTGIRVGTDCRCINCYAFRNTGYGIYQSGDGAAIINCNVQMNQEGGGAWVGEIRVAGNKVRVIGNIIDAAHYDTPGSESHYCIYNTGDNNIITNNHMENFRAGGAAINDTGENTKLSDQHYDVFLDILAVAVDHVRNGEDLSAGIPITFTIDAQPDVPRTITWVLTHANITEYDMEIKGINAKGKDVTVTWDETAGWTGETDVAFAIIESIKMTARTGTGVGDTMDVGIGAKLGLGNEIYDNMSLGESEVYKVTRRVAAGQAADYPSASYTIDFTYHTLDMSPGAGIVVGDAYIVYYRHFLNTIV